MHDFMQELQKHVTVGIVGGSDYKKITEQLGACTTEPIEKLFTYVFSENGLVAYHKGKDRKLLIEGFNTAFKHFFWQTFFKLCRPLVKPIEVFFHMAT